MEDFVVSARKYRPKTFDTVVGQEKITQTLLRSIENNHLAQSFLFCGPRGVGKTTCARIMARAVNQFNDPNAKADEDFSFNIFELDAASNNGVDDIRSLIDQVRIPPQIGKYKVYIIDEVHMLSSAAFNAFLKTLEEPPPYAIFILATTEKHKVLPTILSRCQIFDFNRIQIPEMVEHLASIAQKEQITVESEALHVIAEKADGALRDALSIFDQMVSFSGNELTYQNVIEHLNILDHGYYFSITDAFLAGDKTAALLTFNDILNKGFDAHNFLNGLASHMRNLLFSVSPETSKLLEVGESIREKYNDQSARCETEFLLNAINLLSDADLNFKVSRNQRLLVEINLLKICALSEKLEEKKNEIDLSKAAKSSSSKPEAQPENKEELKQAGVQTLAAPKSAAREPLPPSSHTQEAAKEDLPKTNELGAVQTRSAQRVSPEPDLSQASHLAGDRGLPTNTSAQEKEQHYETKSEHASPKREVSEPKEPVKGFSSKLSNARIKGMTSLKSNKQEPTGNGATADKNSVDDSFNSFSDRPAKDFNMAQLWEAWDAYAQQIKEGDRQSYYATLTKRKPILRENFKVELLLDNEIQKNDLDTDKGELLAFIREYLSNWKIQLTGIVDEEETGDDIDLYSPEAKFKAMAEINPAIATMKQLFDLDVDYDD